MVLQNETDQFPKVHSFYNNNESEVLYKKLAAEQDPLLLQFGERRNPFVPIPLRKIPNKEKFSKPVLNTVDCLISCLIVTPCVVGCWRGIWNLMEMNSFYFPNVETFLLAIFCHVVFALAQEILHHIFIEKRKKYGRVFTFAFTKIYTELFCIVSNMQWRGMWNCYDYIFGIKLENGLAKIQDDRLVIACTLCAIFLLVLMKSLRNIISVPLVIGVDCRDEMFLFSNRFNVSIVYVIVTSTRIQKANPSEKLIGMNSMRHEEYLKVPGSNPKPFGFNFQGPKPHQFTTSTTESVMNYPQLMQYRNQNRYFPKSIQEIIGYVSLNKQSKNAKEKHFGASNLEGIRGNFTSPSTGNGFSAQDPFHYYKPSDPSDVNLLATASFRFAPPIWKTGQNPKSPQILQAQTQTVEDTSAPEPTGYRLPRPIVLTLNIWPMDEVYKAQDLPVVNQPRYGQRYIPISNKNNNYLNYNKGQELRQKLFGTGAMNLNNKKMTINLNFFPDPVNGHGEIQNEESSNFVKKKFLNRY